MTVGVSVCFFIMLGPFLFFFNLLGGKVKPELLSLNRVMPRDTAAWAAGIQTTESPKK